MKKQIITWGLMFAGALALTVSCAKEQDVLVKGEESLEPVGVPFELFAGVDTKTATADGITFTWSENDALNVFYREHGTTGAYSSNNKFDWTSGSSFNGTLAAALEDGKNYDWWALYPYYSTIPSPENTTTGYTSIGGGTQNGNSSTAHLAGSKFPLYGKLSNVANDTKPTFALKQAVSIIKVHVTNANTDALTVTNVSVTAPEAISGQFYINFAGETPVFTAATTTSNTSSLTVSGGAAIAKDGTADFYIPIKPFTQATASTLTVSVNGVEKAVTIPAGTEFKPGKIKTVNFTSTVSTFSWDLSIASYSAQSASQVTWSHDRATMVADKASSSTNANNYLGGDANNRTSSRFYANSKLTFTPADGFQITKVVVTASTSSYATVLKNSTWNNANTTVNDTKVTITPIDGSTAFFATIGNTTGATEVVVFYKEYVPKTLTGIVVTTPPTKTDYKVGDALDMTGAVITASYDDSSSEDVTVSVTTDAETVLAHPGNAKPVTVTYLGKTATFNVNVAKGDAGISYATTSYSVAPDADFDTPTLTNPHGLTITYSSSNESLVLVDENTGDVLIGSNVGGPVTITATAASNDDYNGGTASYTITITDAVDYSTVYTSSIDPSTVSGTSISGAKVVISGAQYDAFKAGTSGTAGILKLKVPAGTSKIHAHVAGWNGETVVLGITPAANISSSKTLNIISDGGVKSSSPFTLSGAASGYYICIELTGIEGETELTFTPSSGNRFVAWGVNLE